MNEYDSPHGSWPPPEPVTHRQATPTPGFPPPRRHRSLPPDVQTPWGWPEVIIFLGVVMFCLILLTILFWSVVRLEMKPADITSFAKTSATFNAVFTASLYVVLIAYLYATIHVRRRLPFWKTIGWTDWRIKRFPRPALFALFAIGGMAMAVMVEVASIPFQPKAKLPIEALFHNRTGVLWLMAVGILLAPAVEETIFRGYLYPVLARTLGVEGGVLTTGLLFGLMHAHQLWGGWAQISLLVFVGIVLTYARARTGTVLTSWLLHLGYNTFLFAGFFISTGGLRHLPPVS